MIIVVNVKNYNPVHDSLIVQAHYAWRMGALLDDYTFRNRFKYLVARKGDEILEVYCIIALSEYPTNETPRRVKFLLEPVSDNCFTFIYNILQNMINNNREYIITRGRHYILEEYLLQNGYIIPNDCDCGIEHIQVLSPDDKRFKAQGKINSTKRLK